MQKTDVINKEYITREEAASLLNITLPTLHRYAKMDRIRIYKFGSRSLLKTEELILAIKENKIIKYGVTSLHLYCKDIFVPLRRTLRIQYLMWLYKYTSCPCIRAGFAFIAPEPISSATVIQIVIQKSRQNTKKPQQNHFYCGFVVVSPGIEPGTQGFSVLCSTN